MIVITTPTGNIGSRVLAHVLEGDQPVRVVAREPEKLPARVRDQVEVIHGSHGDADIVTRALKGADALFWLCPPHRQASNAVTAFAGFTRPAAEVLRSQGVQRVVTISSLGRHTPYADRAGLGTGVLAMDDLIASTGVALRALALPGFMDNMLRQKESIKEQGIFSGAFSSDRRRPTVAVQDIAAVAARLLLDSAWTGQEEVPLIGPEDLSNEDMAAIAAEVLGRPVRYRRVPTPAYLEQLVGLGISEGMAQSMVDLITANENGLYEGVTRTPQHAIDTPTTFRQWCEDTLAPAISRYQ
ncbi:MAG TPA: NAD(P)H-binding protein [Amycolatopsis sp.]|jgi:uncharacterized protein YbjT (DUF2867 family)